MLHAGTPLAQHSRSYPFPAEAVPLKSSGNTVTTHQEDAAVVRKVLESLIVSEGKTVIHLMHSYGGLPGTHAVHGLEAAAPQGEGRGGGHHPSPLS